MKQFLIIIIAGLSTQIAFGQTPDSTHVITDTIPKPQVAPSPPAPDTSAKTTAPPTEKPKSDTRTLREKIDFGFGGGFWTNSRETYIEVCPTVAYRFPKALITGIGYRYIYRHIKEYNGVDVSNDLHSYGPTVFARVNLIKRVYFWTEYEFLNTQYFVNEPGSNNLGRKTTDVDSWFVGLGFSKGVGKSGRGGISVQVLYNILYEDESDAYNPYYSAWTYRVGFFF